MFIKENDNINAVFIYNITKKDKKKTKTVFSFLYHFRTTVNRRTFVGRVGRTNDGRV